MSENNFVLICEKRNKYYLSMRDVDSGLRYGTEEVFANLRDAILRANEMQEEEIVEYGLQIQLEEQN